MNRTKILIAENIPSLNKGEMTILEGILESFKVLGKTDVSMLSDLSEVDKQRYGSKVRIINVNKDFHFPERFLSQSKITNIMFSFFLLMQHAAFLVLYKIFGQRCLKLVSSEIWREYLESDAIIIGHNGTFNAGWAMEKTPIYFYYFYLPLFARSLGNKTVLYGGSVFRYSNAFIAFCAKFALNRIDLITLRENISYKNLRDLGVTNKNVFVRPDLAFLLDPVPSQIAKEIIKNEGIHNGSRPIIGFTVTRQIASFDPSVNASSESAYQKHINMFANAIDTLINELKCTVVFVPHCIGFAEELDDRIVATNIMEICRNREHVKVINNEYNAGELKGLIGQCDLFVGERIHSVINAIVMGIPSIAISYSKDQRLDIIRSAYNNDAICFSDNLDESILLSRIYMLWDTKEQARKDLNAKINNIRKQSLDNGYLLKDLLKIDS